MAGFGFAAAPASGAHHLLRISEVYPAASPNEAFVELQLTAANEHLVDSQDVNTYGPTGVLVNSFEFEGNPPNGQNQRTILVAGSAQGNRDYTDSTLGLSAAGGAVCFESASFQAVDCVAWGAFMGDLPGTAGTPASLGGVTGGKSLTRSIARGCSTQHDLPDDGDDSALDFSEQTPSPRGNPTTPTEIACPNTTLAASPRPANPTNQTGATFEFTGTGTAFECKLDTDPAFSSCTSPKTYATGTIAAGNRTFQVRAVGPGGPDPLPASYSWTIDLTDPDTQINDPKPADPNGAGSSQLNFGSVGEAQPTFRCRLITPAVPSPPFASCTSPFTASTPLSGSYTFEVLATDRAGNQDDSAASHTWTVDRTPPDTNIVSGPTRPTSTVNTATFAFEEVPDEPNVTFECRLITPSDSDPGFSSCPPSYAGLGEGAHRFEVRAQDSFGNEDPTAAFWEWTVDANSDPPPETTITRPPKRTGTDTTPKISFAADPPSGVTFQCRVDAKPFANCTSPHTTRRLKLGRHTFEVFATGPGGVEPAPAKASFKIVRKR